MTCCANDLLRLICFCFYRHLEQNGNILTCFLFKPKRSNNNFMMWATRNIENNPANKTLGMTSAISLASPKSFDLEKTKELEEALVPFDVFETETELNYRYIEIW